MGPLSPAALHACAATFGLQPAELDFISASQNHVYRAQRADGSRSVLRIALDRCHTRREIEGELRWVRWLRDKAACEFICAPLTSPRNALVEEVPLENRSAFVALFRHAKGRPIEEGDLSPELFRAMGRRLGELHARGRGYVEDPCFPRRTWQKSRLLDEDLEHHVPPDLTGFRQTVRNLIEESSQLPRNLGTWGMLHGDFHYQNLYLDADGLEIFDFDNCEHGYFIQDLATCLYDCTLNRLTSRQRKADPKFQFSQPFWEALLSGYYEQHPGVELPHEALEKFLALREAVIYIHYRRLYDFAQKPADWVAAIDGMRKNVEAGRSSISWAH